ncbi:MAG: hypothetical protein JWR90_3350 [Marmoricola sp.]|jgi:uncharacterized protein (TIGR03086 family)|nr:hypothetical protein [Marmoricola sp.]
MSTREHLFSVVASLQPVVHGVSAQEMGGSTPCTEFDVRTVANHMLGTVEAMRRVGASEPLDPQDPWGTNGDNVREQWRDDLSDLLTAYAKAWSQPEAWEGDAMDGALPKQLVGDMGFVEVMLHGWDLAKGSGQDVAYDDAAVERALEIMEVIGEQGRGQGAFGPERDVPDDAPDFAKVLAKSGRDPEWTP